MQIAFRSLACAMLCVVSANAHSQQATSWVSAEWTPVTEENARLQQSADVAFKAAVEADYQKRLEESKAKRPARESGTSGVSASNHAR